MGGRGGDFFFFNFHRKQSKQNEVTDSTDCEKGSKPFVIVLPIKKMLSI